MADENILTPGQQKLLKALLWRYSLRYDQMEETENIQRLDDHRGKLSVSLCQTILTLFTGFPHGKNEIPTKPIVHPAEALTPEIRRRLVEALRNSRSGGYGVIDGFGFSAAMRAQVVEPQYRTALTDWEDANAEALTRLTAAQANRDGISLAERECLCPETKKSDLLQYESKIRVADEAISTAKGELTAKPVASDLFDMRLINIGSYVLQIVLAFGFAFIEAVREGRYKREMADYETGRNKKTERNGPAVEVAKSRRFEDNPVFGIIEGGKS